MNISTISGQAGRVAYSSLLHKTGGQNSLQQAQQTRVQSASEESRESPAEKAREVSQNVSVTQGKSINTYA